MGTIDSQRDSWRPAGRGPQAGPWFQRLSPRLEAPMRLFCFHHAGGSAALYRQWPKRLPEFDVCAVQLPGRINRLCEAPLNRIPEIVEAMIPEILPLIDRPYAFFGHSMGSAVATYLSRALLARGARRPDHLFVSSRQPPHLQYPGWTLRGKNDAQLFEAVTLAFGGMPPELMAHPELLELVMPALRADLEALEDMASAAPLPMAVPITAIGGTSDPYARFEHLQAWQAWTTRTLVVQQLPGDHFYLDGHFDALAALLRRTLLTGGADHPPAQEAA